jgi:hypothetical protein
VRVGVTRGFPRCRQQHQAFFERLGQSLATLEVWRNVWDNDGQRQSFAFHMRAFECVMEAAG